LYIYPVKEIELKLKQNKMKTYKNLITGTKATVEKVGNQFNVVVYCWMMSPIKVTYDTPEKVNECLKSWGIIS